MVDPMWLKKMLQVVKIPYPFILNLLHNLLYLSFDLFGCTLLNLYGAKPTLLIAALHGWQYCSCQCFVVINNTPFKLDNVGAFLWLLALTLSLECVIVVLTKFTLQKLSKITVTHTRCVSKYARRVKNYTCHYVT